MNGKYDNRNIKNIQKKKKKEDMISDQKPAGGVPDHIASSIGVETNDKGALQQTRREGRGGAVEARRGRKRQALLHVSGSKEQEETAHTHTHKDLSHDDSSWCESAQLKLSKKGTNNRKISGAFMQTQYTTNAWRVEGGGA